MFEKDFYQDDFSEWLDRDVGFVYLRDRLPSSLLPSLDIVTSPRFLLEEEKFQPIYQWFNSLDFIDSASNWNIYLRIPRNNESVKTTDNFALYCDLSYNDNISLWLRDNENAKLTRCMFANAKNQLFLVNHKYYSLEVQEKGHQERGFLEFELKSNSCPYILDHLLVSFVHHTVSPRIKK